MSDWDEKAEESTAGRGYKTADEAWAHVAGARWQREALLSDESVERAAQDRDIVRMAEDSGADEPWIVHTVLAAAIGAER